MSHIDEKALYCQPILQFSSPLGNSLFNIKFPDGDRGVIWKSVSLVEIESCINLINATSAYYLGSALFCISFFGYYDIRIITLQPISDCFSTSSPSAACWHMSSGSIYPLSFPVRAGYIFQVSNHLDDSLSLPLQLYMFSFFSLMIFLIDLRNLYLCNQYF